MAQTTSHVVDAEELASIASAMGDYAPMAYLGAIPASGGASAPAYESAGSTSSARHCR